MMTMPPYQCRRAWLRAFWLVVSCTASLVCGIFLAVGGRPHGVGIGGLVLVGVGVPGLVWPHATSKAFRAWNRLARLLAAAARLYVTRICLYTIFPAVGLLGSSMKMDPPASLESGWTRRPLSDAVAYYSPADLDSGALREPGWLRAYFSWAVRSGNSWTIGLIPFLMFLTVVEEDVGTGLPSHDIYTLY